MALLVVSNREPLREQEGCWRPSVGGLTTALLPVLEARGGTWIAWGESRAEEVPRISYPPDDPKLEVRRLALSEREVANYYYGLANRVLWPLCHYFIEQMDLSRDFYRSYREVNRRFAELTAANYHPGDLVWVQDYHLMLVPGLLRALEPEARLGFFFHIPWPAVEVWKMLPWNQELTRGLLGADLLGFHTEEHCKNFLEAATLVPGAGVKGNRVHWGGREVRVEAHPIGIDTASFKALAADPEIRAGAERHREDAGSDFVLLGVDRLDYTKGVLERLLAFEQFLEQHSEYRGRVTFYQLSAPSRTRVESYQELKQALDEVAGRINGAYSQGDWVPVRYYYRSFSQSELVGFYLAADAALVTPIRDGMNVVAQEFALTAERGMLILSSLTGAATVLPEAAIVNPYDIEGVANTIKRVLDMPLEARRERMARLKDTVLALDVHGWAENFLRSLQAS